MCSVICKRYATSYFTSFLGQQCTATSWCLYRTMYLLIQPKSQPSKPCIYQGTSVVHERSGKEENLLTWTFREKREWKRGFLTILCVCVWTVTMKGRDRPEEPRGEESPAPQNMFSKFPCLKLLSGRRASEVLWHPQPDHTYKYKF